MFIRRVLRSSFLYAWVLCLLVIAFHPAELSAVGFRPISPEELKMTAEPAAPGAPAIILYQELYRDDDIKRGFEDHYFRIKILTEEGRKYADIKIPFERDQTPWGEVGEEVRGIHARTIRPDGSIVNFDGKVFTNPVAKGRGIKYLAKTFTLPDVQVGSIIEYYYTIGLAEYAFFDSHWILSNELFTKAAKFSLKPYKPQGPVSSSTDLLDQDHVSISPTYYFRWTFQNIPPAALQAKAGSDQMIHVEASDVASSQNLPLMGREADRIVHLEVSNVPAFHTEDFMPPMDELKERIDFNYILDKPEDNPKQFWSKVGERLDGEVEGFIGKRKALEKTVSEIVGPNDPPEVKLQKIYARVQQMRNTSYEVRKTEEEMERAKQQEPTSAEKAWKLGYASGGNLTWLYLALVRAAGFESYGVVVANRQRYFLHPNMMQSQRLDTNLVLVKLNGKDFWCDPGAAFTPFGLLPWQETGVQGLQLDKKGRNWIQTLVPTSAQAHIERHANLTLSDTGDLEGKLAVTYTGLEAARLRMDERHADETERKKYLEDEVKGYIPASSEVNLTNQPEWKNSALPLVAELAIKIPGWAPGAGRHFTLPVGPFSAQEKHMFDHAKRDYPIYFHYPFMETDDINIQIPSGWQVSGLPHEGHETGNPVTYSFSVQNDNGKLHLSREFTVDFILMEAGYYAALRYYVQKIKTTDDQQIVLDVGATGTGN